MSVQYSNIVSKALPTYGNNVLSEEELMMSRSEIEEPQRAAERVLRRITNLARTPQSAASQINT